MNVVKHLLGGASLLLTVATTYAAYQPQGFTVYQENPDGTINFSCEQQCFLLMGPLGSQDRLRVQGTFQWAGQIGYGLLVGQQVYPGEAVPVANSLQELSWAFAKHPAFAQLPKATTSVVFVANSQVTTTNARLWTEKLSFTQSLAQWWNDFRTNEPLRPYSINLRYGVKVWNTPLFKLFYRLFALSILWVVFTVRNAEKRKHTVIAISITLILLFTYRNLWNRTDWTRTWLRSYTFASAQQKSFYDLGDYPVFVDHMRKTLGLDEKFGQGECTIYFDAFQERPFKVHADTVYSKPCEPAIDKDNAQYIVYYKKPIDSDRTDKPVLLEFNGSFLIQNK